ncbi:hypothetical protein AAB992_33865 [Burkholderia contaminans]|uniref:hypothetical protein n=1 Tax=Burkholderia contaminans TaxID=488447 RepID=UPI002416E7A7|nr:hypothetical protein [Burkholderia contaminans]WFN09695.1 hypothetical protein LXE92_16595 [Burkholderia contaminans]
MRFRATASGSAAGSADRKSWARPTFADFSDRRDTVTGQLPASGSDPHGSDSACGRSVGHLASPSTIAKIRQQTLADSHARPATVVQATYDRLKPALDVGGRGAAHVGSAGVYPLSQDAIAYAWLLNDASMYLVGTGDNAPERESGSPACIDPLQPLLAGDMRPRPGPPRRLVQAISANILQCAAHCILPSCKPTNVSNWSVYRSESSAYKRHPACPYDARLVQLSINACAGLDAGAFSAPHQSDDDEGKPACYIQSSASTARHPALVVPIQEQGRNMPCRFSPVDGSALRDSSTACTVRSAGVDAGGTHFAFMGEGRDCFGRTAHSLEEACVARWAARARPKEQRGFLVLSGR